MTKLQPDKPLTRETAVFLSARDLDDVLRKAGVDSKIVTKHAVQIDPDQAQEAKAAVQCEKLRRSAA